MSARVARRAPAGFGVKVEKEDRRSPADHIGTAVMSMPIGVVGMGLLGRGIAACLLERGYQVVAVARTADKHAMALPIIEQMIGELVQHGVAPPELLDQWRLRLNQVTTWEPLAPCRFVIESVYDDLAVKQSVFDEIERVVGERRRDRQQHVGHSDQRLAADPQGSRSGSSACIGLNLHTPHGSWN